MAESDEKHGRTLFVRNLPYSATNDSLEKIFSDVGPLKSCFVVKDKDSGKCRGFGYVKFTLLEDAEKALSSVKKVDGRAVHLIYANKKEKKKRFGAPNKQIGETTTESDVQNETSQSGAQPVQSNGGTDNNEQSNKNVAKKNQKKKNPGLPTPMKGQRQAPNPHNEGKRARLIVRNLAFRCTKEELQEAFEKCGTVVDVHIPKKPSGTRLGFGFVQFENKAQAGMAVAQLNGTSVAGRQVAVDWSLPKDMYEARVPAKQEIKPTVEEVKEEPVDEEEEEEEMEVDDDEQKVEIKEEIKSEDEESSEEEEEEEDGSSDEDDDESGSEDEDEENTQKKPTPASRPSDVEEGRTIFMRNLPFSTNEEEITDCFSEFGDVKYARIVKDRNSGMSKGSAFVQFTSKEGASASLDAANDQTSGGITLQGRQLIVSLAVSREQAGILTTKMEEEKKKKVTDQKEEKDSRNLYLAREGMIRPGTEAAKDVPAADLALRTKIAEANRIKLKDQNVFVSSTRLCVHNIPPTIEESKLKMIILKATDDKAARITECRIMRDLARVNSQGQGKSKGFAFISFTQHVHALAALKKLNNCPNVFGDKKRPIVEFSLENRKALEAKQKRLEKSRIKMKPNPNTAKKTQQTPTGDNQAESKQKKKKDKRKGKQKTEALPLEAKKQQDKVARSMYQGPLGLPSHSGPKQRHKPRPGQQQAAKKGKTKGLNSRNQANGRLKQPQSRAREPQAQSMKPKKRKDVDSFDKLVASYKQKIMASAKF